MRSTLGRSARELAGLPAGVPRRAAQDGPARRTHLAWPLLAVLAPLACFIAASIYVERWSTAMDAATVSIVANGSPSVVELSLVREGTRRIARLAMLARPASLARDRAAMAALIDDFDRAEAAYRATPEYPGEPELYLVMKVDRARFFGAVEEVLAAASERRAPSPEEIARLQSTTDALAATTQALVELNAHQVAEAGRDLARLRRQAVWLQNARDALAFLFVIAGTTMGLRGVRQQAQLAEERRRRDQERMAELDLFSTRVAGDLRGFLSMMLVESSAGREAPTLASAREALAHIAHLSRRMNTTIEALLVFAQAGARPAPGSHGDAETAVREVVADLSPLATESGIAIVVEPLHHAKVACDPAVLNVVLSNLVSNAIKYAAEGGRGARRIVLRGRAEGENLRLEVEDTGPGLPAGARETIFDPLARVDGVGAGKEGIGLGLATVKRLVEAHGGEVGVESQAGAGCRFWFTLPSARERGPTPSDA